MFRCGLCFYMLLLFFPKSLGKTSTVTNFCASDPCKNGGTCEEQENNFYCECPPHFVGITCEQNQDICGSNPCFNGGTCEVVEDGPYPFICACTEKYAGRFCNLTNLCVDNPCANNGTCEMREDWIYPFLCICTEKFGGRFCNLTIKNCLSNPCKNGGTCEEKEDGFYCHCPSHFGGKTCSLSFEICESHPCLNGGTCIVVEDGPREYMCKCNDKYSGKNCEIKKPPMISDRYHTVGELVFPLVPDREISEAEIVCAIEESYDPRQGMSVLQVTIAGEQDTIVENLILNQTFMHNSSGCFEMTNSEWREDGVPPDLAMYEIMLGQVVFPVRQLLSIEDRFLVDGNNPTTFRGLPAIRYSYSIFTMNPDNNGNITIDIDAFWSDGSMNMSSKESQVPLGFIINRKVIDSDNPNGKEMVHHINLFVFLHSVVNKRMHWAREGEYCYGRKPVFPFPEVKTLTAFSYHTEITLPDFETILNTDGWMDTRNQIFRIDYDPVIQSQPQLKTRDFYSDIITINQGSGIAYRRLPDETCKILKIRSEDFDPQFIIDPRKKTSYNPTEFFGTRKTNFIDIGMVWKRGIPCRKFQGLRIDWPPDVNGITTLWEWCFLDNYLEWSKNTDGSFPVVSLEIYVTESPYNISSGVYYKGLRFWYNFYDMKKQSSVYLDNVAFDISSCFSANHKEFLEFQVSYDLQYFEELQDIIVNPMFQAEWKESITAAAQLKTSSLRITQVKSMIVGRDFFVQFTVLDRHPDLPDGIRKKEISMTDLINNLTQAVDLKEIGVDWPLADRNQNKVLKLRSVPNSLKTQFERGITTSTTSKPTTISSMVTETTTTNTPKKPSSPSSSSISTKEVVTTTVAPTKTTLETTVLITSSENPETTIELKKKKGGEKKLYSPGAMGGVAMAMLIIGIGLGVGGTFAKFKIFDNRDNSYKN